MKTWSKVAPHLTKKVLERVVAIYRIPFDGFGKREALKHQYRGMWLRKIFDEHRLIYKILSDGTISILSVHGHYG